jgi:iron transport multicopper oxidase
MLKLILFFLSICLVSLADKHYDFDITWVNAAPDGFNRPVIGINGNWPLPVIECDVGERVTVVVNNKLGNESTSIHFHGIRQFNTNTMDGPSSVTQCPIPPGSTFTYSFIADTAGTYWYHCMSPLSLDMIISLTSEQRTIWDSIQMACAAL